MNGVYPEGGGALGQVKFTLGSTYALSLVQGAFTLTGETVGFATVRIVAAVQGAFTLTGETAVLGFGRVLVLVQGAFSMAGEAVGFATARIVAAVHGAFTLTGGAVIFTLQSFRSMLRNANYVLQRVRQSAATLYK